MSETIADLPNQLTIVEGDLLDQDVNIIVNTMESQFHPVEIAVASKCFRCHQTSWQHGVSSVPEFR